MVKFKGNGMLKMTRNVNNRDKTLGERYLRTSWSSKRRRKPTPPQLNQYVEALVVSTHMFDIVWRLLWFCALSLLELLGVSISTLRVILVVRA